MIRRIFQGQQASRGSRVCVHAGERVQYPCAFTLRGAGLWQFMPGTGRHYGLRIDDTVDDRLDPEKSTYASAKYFKELIAIFGGKAPLCSPWLPIMPVKEESSARFGKSITLYATVISGIFTEWDTSLKKPTNISLASLRS